MSAGFLSCIKTYALIQICQRVLQRVTYVFLLHDYITLTECHLVIPVLGSWEHVDSSMSAHMRMKDVQSLIMRP